MIDDQFGGAERIDAGGVAAEMAHGVAHGGEIDDGGDSGEVLQEDAGRREGDFLCRLNFRVPLYQRGDVFWTDAQAVLGSQQVFEEDLEREGQASGLRELLEDRIKTMNGVASITDIEDSLAAE